LLLLEAHQWILIHYRCQWYTIVGNLAHLRTGLILLSIRLVHGFRPQWAFGDAHHHVSFSCSSFLHAHAPPLIPWMVLGATTSMTISNKRLLFVVVARGTTMDFSLQHLWRDGLPTQR